MREWFIGVIDLILPRVCAFCGVVCERGSEKIGPLWGGLTICEGCNSKLPLILSPKCPRCGLPFASPVVHDHLCGECIQSTPPFDSTLCLLAYEPFIRELIQRMKYQSKAAMARFFGHLLAHRLGEAIRGLHVDGVIPIPMYKMRLRHRGFNQAAVMAIALGRGLGLPVHVDWLRKTLDTPSQVGLTRAQREANVKGSFSLSKRARVSGGRWLLVDDVFTTGATLREAARTLKRAKAKEVHAVTLARVP